MNQQSKIAAQKASKTIRTREPQASTGATVSRLQPKAILRTAPKDKRSSKIKKASAKRIPKTLKRSLKKSQIKNNKMTTDLSEIEKLKKCNSKAALFRILTELSEEWRDILRFYMNKCFIHDLYTRRLANKMFLLSKRNLLYRLIDAPELLNRDCHFDNNLLKNFCTGVANFVNRHKDSILEMMRRQG